MGPSCGSAPCVGGSFMNDLAVEIGLGYWGALEPFQMSWRGQQEQRHGGGKGEGLDSSFDL